MKTMQFSWKNLLFSVIVSILITIFFSGCGSYRTDSINKRDDLQYRYTENRVDNTIVRENAKTKAGVNAWEVIGQDAESTIDQKYPGIISTPMVSYTIKYEIELNNTVVASWTVYPRSQPKIRKLTPAEYTVFSYILKRGTWQLQSRRIMKVTNLPTYDNFHFALNGF